MSQHDAIELAFFYAPHHPDPEAFLRQIETRLRGSLVEALPQVLTEQEQLERQQERWIAQAESFAAAHGIQIDGCGDSWVLTNLNDHPVIAGKAVNVEYAENTQSIEQANRTDQPKEQQPVAFEQLSLNL